MPLCTYLLRDEVKTSWTCCIALMLLSCEGNENLHWLTSVKRQQLRIDMADWDGNTAYALYDNFKVGSEQEKYKLSSVGKYRGTAGQYHI